MFRYAFVFSLASAIVVGIIVVTVIFYEDTAPAPRATDTPATVERSTDTLTSAPQITVRPDPAATSLPTRAVQPPTATTRPTRTPQPPTATPAPTATSVPIPLPGGPANVRYIYHRDGRVVHSGFADFVRVSWEPVEGADYYKVYARAWMFDEQGPMCQLNREGRPLNFCKLVISNLKETTYTFESPANLIRSGEEINRHWVASCNRGGCSGLVLAVPTATATPGIRATSAPAPTAASAPAPAAGPKPSKLASVWAVREGATIRVGWEPVAGADYYKVYYDDFFPSGCTVGRDGRLHWCEELASGVTETSYVHTNPDRRTNYYWITACSSRGCSTIDSKNPAAPQS